jgi:hypothetical protein
VNENRTTHFRLETAFNRPEESDTSYKADIGAEGIAGSAVTPALVSPPPESPLSEQDNDVAEKKIENTEMQVLQYFLFDRVLEDVYYRHGLYLIAEDVPMCKKL